MVTRPKNLRLIKGIEHKDCSVCNECLPVSNFRTKKTRTDTLIYRSECIACGNNAVKVFRQQMKQKAVEYLGGVCKDCQYAWPLSVYDFHHLDPGEKDISLSKLLRKKRVGWDAMKLELDKCALLCSNCHRIRHHD